MADARILQVTCPLGADVFVLDAFSGREGLSQLFAFELELASTNLAVAPADVVGKPMGFSIRTAGQGERFFHGRVRAFSSGPLDSSGMRRYRAHVVPWLWFLTKRQGCRIFQGKKVTEIAEALFGELGFGDYKLQVRGAQNVLEYCVQYRESDFDFLSRLFEEFGIFYHFEHADGVHTLVLSDAKTAFTDCAEARVKYATQSVAANCVTAWERDYQYTSGKWTARDYDFTKSDTQLESTVATVVDLPNIAKYEVYEHPGGYAEGSLGDAKTKASMEALEATHDIVRGESSCATFRPAGKFTLEEHPVSGENKAWVILQIEHRATEPSIGQGGAAYANAFRCMLASKNFRPLPLTRRPLIHGLQTALVVGPDGEELYTDEHGRIRVQFHWDREGQKNESSSCWIRVAQPWAGKSFGAFHLPRIGQEVVVAFMEGDPDRPLVVGSVYNNVQTPPFALPANKTQTGLRTRSTPDGGADNCNELRFEDKAGSELVFLHAEKDEQHEVEHDQTLTVGNDQSITVSNNRSETIEKDRSLHVGGNKSETVDGDTSITITGKHDETIKKTRALTVEQDERITVNGKSDTKVAQDHTLSVDGGSTIGVKGALAISTQDAMTLAVEKDLAVTVTGEHKSTAKKLEIEIEDEAVIKVGSAKLTLKKNGDISIEGGKITVKGSGDVVIKGSKVAMN